MNETLSVIIICFLIAGLTAAVFQWYKQKQVCRELSHKLDQLNGLKEEEIFGKAKFSELGLMCAGIAHEISNPLAIIQGRAFQLEKIVSDPKKATEINKGLQQIAANTERISRVIKGIRDYLYKDDASVENDIFLKELFDGVDVFFQQRLKNHGIELRLKNLEGIYVRGHRGQLEQVVLNLINNSFDAIDHLPEKWIEVCAQKVNGKVEIIFRDSGRGIPVSIKEQMMNPFFTTKKTKGSGLGLPLIKSIVQKHGGELSYVDRSEYTTFRLELPAAQFMTNY